MLGTEGSLGRNWSERKDRCSDVAARALAIFREDADWVRGVALQPKHGEVQIIVFSSPKKCARFRQVPDALLEL